MPWWSWVVIWVGLVVALLAMLVWFAWWLFRKAASTARALGELAGKVDLLEVRAEELAQTAKPAAAFDDPALWREVRAQQRAARDERRLIRREARVARGRLLVRNDPRRFFPDSGSPSHNTQ